MAQYLSIAVAKHGNLQAGVIDEIQFANNYRALEVKHRAGLDDIFFRIDGQEPTVLGADTYIVQAGESVVISNDRTGDTIKLISAGEVSYSVTGLNRVS